MLCNCARSTSSAIVRFASGEAPRLEDRGVTEVGVFSWSERRIKDTSLVDLLIDMDLAIW